MRVASLEPSGDGRERWDFLRRGSPPHPPPTWISGTPDSLPPNQWFSARGGFVSGAVWGYFGIYNLGGIGLASSG